MIIMQWVRDHNAYDELDSLLPELSSPAQTQTQSEIPDFVIKDIYDDLRRQRRLIVDRH